MVIKKGSKGTTVKQLQEFLEIEADGVFGPGTEQAVISFQKANGLVADGIGSQQFTGIVTAEAEAAQDNVIVNIGAGTTRPYDGQVVFFDRLYKSVETISVGSGACRTLMATFLVIH